MILSDSLKDYLLFAYFCFKFNYYLLTKYKIAKIYQMPITQLIVLNTTN